MKRPTTLAGLEEVVNRLFSQESMERGMAFQPKPSDVIICPYAKSGTTWLQQIAHGLRTRGNMDFEEITVLTPWIEVAHDMGWDLDGPQVAEPRVYKSHLAWHEIPKGGRYIVSIRHPHDAFVSFVRFMEGWFIERGVASLAEFFRWRYPPDELEKRGYWYHLNSWWEQRQNENVLLLCYEEMRADLPGTVKAVARFMGIPLDDQLLDIVVRQSSKEFMLAHKDQFDERPFRRRAEIEVGLPYDGDAAKVTPGAGGDHRYRLTPAIRAGLDEFWREHVERRFGFKDYEALREAIRELHVD
jgi:hypothetical protein